MRKSITYTAASHSRGHRMSNYACPECHALLERIPKRGQDGRCLKCRMALPVNGYKAAKPQPRGNK